MDWTHTSSTASQELNAATPLGFVENTSLHGTEPTNLKLGRNSSLEVLQPALNLAESYLQEFANSSELSSKMTLAFGTDWNVNQAIDFAKSWTNHDFSQLPQIEIVLGTEISGANGAFAAQTNRIYLSSDFLTQNAHDANIVTSVVLEEIGHFIDFRLNSIDSLGDEGDIFSRLVRGEAISASELAGLKTENDHTLVMIDGMSIEIEMSQIAMADLNGTFYQSHQGLDNKIYTRRSTDGVNWSSWNNNGGGETLNAPSLAALNGRLYQSHRGMDSKIYTRSSSDGENWTVWESNGKGDTPNAPALTAHNGKLYQSIRGLDNNIYTRSSSDGKTWTEWESQRDRQTLNAPTLVSFNGKLLQACQGTDNKVYTRSSLDGVRWSAWSDGGSVAGSFGSPLTRLTASGAVAMNSLSGQLFQSVRGADNKMYIRSSRDGAFWSTWSSDKVGDTPDAPSIFAFKGKLYQVHQGLDLKIYTRSSLDGKNWGNWTYGQGLTPTETPGLNVWHASYFNSNNLTGQAVLNRAESAISYDWGIGSPDLRINRDNFSARWEGQFYFDAGSYTFKPNTDDGVRIWIDGKLVHDFWNSPTNKSFKLDITRGLHQIKVEYRELGGDARAHFSWEKSTLPSTIDQANSFFKLQYYDVTYNSTSPNNNPNIIGGNKSFTNNCGPTSLAMVMNTLGLEPKNVSVETSIDHARYLMYGKPGNASERQGIKVVDEDWRTTNWKQLDAGIRNAGGTSEEVRSWAILDQNINLGKPMILYGQYDSVWRNQFPNRNLTSNTNAAHFIALLGKTGSGKYIVADPLYRGGTVEMTKAQLTVFFRGVDNPSHDNPYGRAFALS